MSAENENKPAGEDRKGFAGMSREELRARADAAAKHARAKSEFILSRAYGLFRDPKLEWDQIKAEETTIASILLGYVAPLSGFFSVCVLVGSLFFEHPPFVKAVISAIVTFLVLTGMIYLIGFILNTVAEYFDAQRNELGSQKVAAYAFTPFFLSGVFWLWPPLIWVSIIAVGLSAYLLYRGLIPLMKAPVERATPYAVTVCTVGLVAFIAAFLLASCVTSIAILA